MIQEWDVEEDVDFEGEEEDVGEVSEDEEPLTQEEAHRKTHLI
jgi:hypothetical protein